MLGNYLQLTKPRMVLGNVIVAASAFVFGLPAQTAGHSWAAFWLMTVGLWLVVSSACTLNNYYDRGIDAHMMRTQGRALVLGAVRPGGALLFGAAALIAGAVLLWLVNFLALWAGLIGWASYVLLYTPIKHRSGYALYVGAISGAMPPVVGYVAASGRLDAWAAMLFVVLYVWQLPHFIAIAIYRFDEYAAASVPLLVRRPASTQARSRARAAFYASLGILLLFCAALILQRWIK